MQLLGSLDSGICLETGEGALLGPSAVGVGDSEGDPVREARRRICLFVGLSVGMKGGVAQGRVPSLGRGDEGALGREGFRGRPQALVWAPVFGEGVSEGVPALAWASPSRSCFCSALATAWSQGSEEESLSERVGQGRRGMSVKERRNLHLEIGWWVRAWVCWEGCWIKPME